ncbi:MAG: class F sortase [Chloroflexi bacterium]|nr:class F sortase [Chloroflexota bacterium]
MPSQRTSSRYKYTGKRRLYVILSTLFMLVGIGMIGVATYEFAYRGNDPSQLIWVRPGEPVAPAVADGSQPPPQAQTVGTEPFRLVIDKIGVDAPVSTYGLDENALPRVPYDADLVAWYDFSSYPGNGENAVFAGHVTWDGDAVFKRLGELETGDRIRIQREDGNNLIYEVTEVILVESGDPTARDWMLPAGEDVVTLITCGGERYLTDDYIGADYTHRQIIRGSLIAAA